MGHLEELATRMAVPLDKVEEIWRLVQAETVAGGKTSVYPKAKELPLGRSLYTEAYRQGMSVSAWLEHLDPSHGYNDGLDAFERQLKIAGIVPNSDPGRGIWADRIEKFWNSDKPGSEWLLPEFIARVWRKTSAAMATSQRFYASSAPVSKVLYPDYIQETIRAKQIEPAIPLSALVAIVTPVEQGAYTAFYLTDDATQYTMRRVTEGGEVPEAKLTGGDHTIRLKKYGRRLTMTYEALRRMRADLFARHIALCAVKAEVDKVTTALDVLVNGDGNAGTTPTNYNLTTLDADATAGTLTLKGYLAWRMKWASPYLCNVIIAQEAGVLQVLLLNVGSANVPFAFLAGNFGIGGVAPINRGFAPVGIGWESTAPALTLVGIDNRFALEMIQDIGMSLTETDKLIGTQVNQIVMTEMIGFAVLDANANKTLTISA